MTVLELRTLIKQDSRVFCCGSVDPRPHPINARHLFCFTRSREKAEEPILLRCLSKTSPILSKKAMSVVRKGRITLEEQHVADL
ncbi:hypothetical protein NPIL_401061 [Nephila pilipes]|uniref:Uncharacterized protein n=1 Tax=Nephila pilipes TaxID=299642 RepID=A0A8X6Q1P3_NEPPI|nr:hypothetical protein NPIL_401061 [Nephila pilipes]